MSKLIEQLKRHEGFRSKPYKCSEGFLTIGYGLNLDAGISEGLAEVIMERQIYGIKHKLVNQLNCFCGLNEARQDVIINMVFNIGYDGFMQFKNTIKYLDDGYFEVAAKEMLNSKWANQVGNRAIELSEQMRTGEYA